MDWSQIGLLTGLGISVGFIGTLIGAGGGFILVPVLLFLYPDMQPETVTSISLGVVFLNAGSGSVSYAKMKRIDYKSAIIFALATLPGSVIGAFMTAWIDRNLFNIFLGIVLTGISILLLIKPTSLKKAKVTDIQRLTHRDIIDGKGQRYKYKFRMWTGIVLSFFVGYLSSLLGIGGGIIHVPVLTLLLNFPTHIATATSHLILAIMALGGTIVHLFQGNLKGQIPTLLSLGAGVVVGAQFGARFSEYVKPQWIIRALAIALLLVGVRLIFF